MFYDRSTPLCNGQTSETWSGLSRLWWRERWNLWRRIVAVFVLATAADRPTGSFWRSSESSPHCAGRARTESAAVQWSRLAARTRPMSTPGPRLIATTHARHTHTTHSHTHTNTRFKGYFPGNHGLAGCPDDLPSSFIPKLCILLRHAQVSCLTQSHQVLFRQLQSSYSVWPNHSCIYGPAASAVAENGTQNF